MTHALVSTTVPSSVAADAPARSVWRHGAVAGLVAAAATFAIAGLADLAGVSFADSSGTAIPLGAFAEFTFVFALVGVVIAAVLARRAHRPRSTFVKVTVALTALSVVPHFTMGFEAAAIPVLMASHLAAAAIVIPALARRLESHR